MSKLVRRLAAFCLAATAFCSGGCRFISLDADGLLRAPKLTGDQAGVQGALEDYVVRQSGQADYTLKCPKGGENLTSFLFLDQQTEPTRAVAFYACPTLSANVRILYLEKQEEVWQGLTDIEGNSEDIGQVFLGDVDADGQQELLIGWDLYTTRDHRLKVYDITHREAGPSLQVIYDTTYSAMVLADMTGTQAEDLLLFNIVTTEEHVSARLLCYEQGGFTEKGSTRIDGSIVQIKNGTAVQWSDATAGVFVDGVKDGRIFVTELILWDGTALTAPFYQADKNRTARTARESNLPCADTNGNGVPEWPLGVRLPGYEQTDIDQTMWQTTYYEWTGQSEQATVTAIVNAADGYRIELGADLADGVTAVYQQAERMLEMRAADTGEALLRVRIDAAGKPLPDGYRLLQQTEAMQCTFWVPEQKDALITPEQARYMIVLI